MQKILVGFILFISGFAIAPLAAAGAVAEASPKGVDCGDHVIVRDQLLTVTCPKYGVPALESTDDASGSAVSAKKESAQTFIPGHQTEGRTASQK